MVDHILFACQCLRRWPNSHEKGNSGLLGSPSLFSPRFHSGIRLKMSCRFPPMRIAGTDNVPSLRKTRCQEQFTVTAGQGAQGHKLQAGEAAMGSPPEWACCGTRGGVGPRTRAVKWTQGLGGWVLEPGPNGMKKKQSLVAVLAGVSSVDSQHGPFKPLC